MKSAFVCGQANTKGFPDSDAAARNRICEFVRLGAIQPKNGKNPVDFRIGDQRI